MPGGTYEFSYEPTSPYAHAVTLISRHRAPKGEVVVDLGCGYGAIAGPVADLGLDYLGIDADPEAVGALAERGVAAMLGDLTDPGTVFSRVTEALAGRRVAAICALDALEHLANAAQVLGALSCFARELGEVPLVVSVPNVSHRDLAIKLLLGRWDVTPTGLLDETHVRFFSPAGLERAMTAAGWVELESFDFAMARSDQHFPADCVALVAETPLGGALQQVRGHAAPGTMVNQFVRAYRPTEPAGIARPDGGVESTVPFISVVIRTDGRKLAPFDDLLASLAGQDHDDFEVVVVMTVPDPDRLARVGAAVDAYDPTFARRVRVVPTEWPLPLGAAGNLGVAGARGRYVVVLDDDQMAFGHWVETLARVAAAAPGRVVHAGVATQNTVATPGRWQRATGGQVAATDPGDVEAYDVVDRPRSAETFAVGLLELLGGPPRPICGFALPRSFFTDLGERFDEDLPALEDWDLLLRAVERCGVVTTGEIGLLRRSWVPGPAGGGEAPAPAEGHGGVEGEGEGPRADGDVLAKAFARAEAMIAAKLDAQPLLLDRGSASRLGALLADVARTRSVWTEEVAAIRTEVHQLSAAVAEAETQLAAVHASTSWRVTAPLRAAVDRWRGR